MHPILIVFLIWLSANIQCHKFVVNTRRLVVNFDGGYRPNEMRASSVGIFVEKVDEAIGEQAANESAAYSLYTGSGSHNGNTCSEYQAFIEAVYLIRRCNLHQKYDNLILQGDSEIVINRISRGIKSTLDPVLSRYHRLGLSLFRSICSNATLSHVERSDNAMADRMATLALNLRRSTGTYVTSNATRSFIETSTETSVRDIIEGVIYAKSIAVIGRSPDSIHASLIADGILLELCPAVAEVNKAGRQSLWRNINGDTKQANKQNLGGKSASLSTISALHVHQSSDCDENAGFAAVYIERCQDSMRHFNGWNNKLKSLRHSIADTSFQLTVGSNMVNDQFSGSVNVRLEDLISRGVPHALDLTGQQTVSSHGAVSVRDPNFNPTLQQRFSR